MNMGKLSLVIATNNSGKLSEFRELLQDLPVELLGIADVVPDLPPVVEDGATFEANAIKKAQAVAEAALMLTLADDSGLEVDALGGAPGVRSARYAGDRATDAENNAALLRALDEVPEEARTARFRCVLCLVDPWAPGGPSTTTVAGVCEGMVARSARGAGGFGYDPLFVVQGGSRTLAEFGDAEKNAISHRGAAVRAMLPHLLAVIEERAKTTERISFSAPPPRP
ncbi:MAG: RdgB/HAM1 family non-canonical purine NTP pyrophosphatase [Deltaproteobacteria bacterium]|nr:RdgB/HAM1 family non-canonical purine NTP pyrophosphatase [Deltaproteobacteria bacterium]